MRLLIELTASGGVLLFVEACANHMWYNMKRAEQIATSEGSTWSVSYQENEETST